MSPVKKYQIDWVQCFPRVSGDEPAVRSARCAGSVFSPRERG